MAKRFLRLDLSANARDFETATVEPGLPLLDKSNANHRVLRKWLGRLIAEPEWQGKSVDLFVCDEQQARLQDVRCEPATADDLRRHRELAQDLDELVKRLERVKPAPKEVKLHEAIVRHFRKLTAESGPMHKECHFFKYREANVWRLVWGWGYQRKDLEPASPAICTNPNCALLFVRHSEGSGNCPACEKEQTGDGNGTVPWWRRAAKYAAVALLGAVIGVFIYWWLRPPAPPQPPPPPGLYATPAEWTGPVGGQVRFDVVKREADGKEEDVTARVVAVAEHPKVVFMDNVGTTARARGTGKTVVHFYLGRDEARATVEVEAAKNPAKIVLDPAEVTLGIGTTAQLRVFGQYADGRKVDLTDVAEWEPVAGAAVYCCQGRLEGKASGEASVVARYRATPSDDYLPAEAKIKVVEEKYQSLELAVKPTAIMEGRAGELSAQVVGDSGQKRSVLNSSQLKLQVDPSNRAKVEGDYLRGLKVGQGSLKAAFRDLSASQPFEVSANTDGILRVSPKQLQVAVGETARVQVISASTDPLQWVSSAPAVAEVFPDGRVVGRASGKAKVTVSQEARQAEVEVDVRLGEVIKSVKFLPARVSVPVDGSTPLRLIGQGASGEIELAPDRIVWEALPNSAFAELDLKALQVRGRQPTGATPQAITARYGQHRATAQVDVVAPPVQIELTPAGPVQLPVGMTAQLHAWARYGDGRRVEIPPERLQWRLYPAKVQGIELDESSASMRATEANKGPLGVRARYQGSESASVEFRSTEVAPTLELQADRTQIVVNDRGQFRVSSPEGAGVGLSLDGAQFESSDNKLLEVQKNSGAYRAMGPGKVTVKATHPKAKAPVQKEFEVFDKAKLLVLREPEGEEVLAGGQQRYAIVVQGGDRQEPAVGVEWQSPFENDYVVWDPPVLTAKRAGHEQRLSAAVGQDRTSWTTRTVRRPTAADSPPPPPRPEKPERVSIVFSHTEPITIPVRAQFDDFRVEAVFPDKLTTDVTPQATLLVQCADPQQAPVSVEAGRLRGQRPGSAVVHAELNGVRSTAGMSVKVEPVTLTSVEIEPRTVELGSSENVTLRLKGFTGNGDGRRFVGDVASQPGVEWKSDSPDVLRVDGPTLRALKAGTAKVTAAAGGAEDTIEVTIVEVPSEPDLSPNSLRLGVGETKWLGKDVTLRRGAVDLSSQLRATSSDNSIVQCNPNGSLEGVSPGQAQVALTAGGHSFRLPVLVELDPDAGAGTVLVEPAADTLNVGESREPHVILLTKSGQRVDRTGSAILESANPGVLAVFGTRVTGMAPGQSTVTARLPGIDEPGRAAFTVVEGAAPVSLAVVPPSLRMAAGEQASFRVIGQGPDGPRDLTHDPNLKVTAGGAKPQAIQWQGAGDVRGVSAGQAELHIAWRNLTAPAVPVTVDEAAPPSQIRIVPPEATITEGANAPFIVFARQGNVERAVTPADGLRWTITNTAIATLHGGQIRGSARGRTTVTARLHSAQAAAQLEVTPPPPPGDPPGPWTGLRFIPDRRQLQLGQPGLPFRVVKRAADGRVEDVAHLAEYTVADPSVARVKWIAQGPIVEPLKLGQTRIDALVKNEDLRSHRPMLVQVSEVPRDGFLLVVRPDPLHLTVGETGGFSGAHIIARGGAEPVNVDYRVQSGDAKIVAVEGGKGVRGVAPGTARVTVTPVDVGPQLADLSTDVTVNVSAAGPSGGPEQLVLTGPSRTVAGAEVRFQVERVSDNQRQDVTNNGAELVLDYGAGKQADVRPGCILAAKQAGTITVRARHNDLVSNELPLRIDPLGELERLELEIERQPMAVEEARPYKLWGHPVGGGPRQDLTSQVRPAGSQETGVPKVGTQVVEPAGGKIVEHVPPVLTAKEPGRFQLRASYGPDLRSNVVDLDILALADGGKPVDLVVEPPSVAVNPGDRTPPMRVLARRRAGEDLQPVAAPLTSENDAVVAPDPQSPGQFVAKAPGKTRLKAAFGGLEASAEVNVSSLVPFQIVRVMDEPDFKPEGRFTVTVSVLGIAPPDAGLEYRVVTPGSPEEGAWAAATSSGNQVTAMLNSPVLRLGPRGTVYHVIVQARPKERKTILQYPLPFVVVTGDERGPGAK